MNEKLIEAIEHILSLVQPHSGGPWTNDIRRACESALEEASQPSQQSGGGVPTIEAMENEVKELFAVWHGPNTSPPPIPGEPTNEAPAKAHWFAWHILNFLHLHLTAQQPPRVDLSGVEKMIDFEIRSHLGVPMDSIDVMVRHNLATAILDKLIALPQTEKGEPVEVWATVGFDGDGGAIYDWVKVPADGRRFTGLLTADDRERIYEGDKVSMHQFNHEGGDVVPSVEGVLEYSDDVAAFGLRITVPGRGNEIEVGDWVPVVSFYGLHEESFTILENSPPQDAGKVKP